MATTIKSRIPLLLLLGIIFLASVSVTYANYDDEGTEPRVPAGQRERGRQEGEKEGSEPRVPGQRERGRQEGEKEEKRHEEMTPSHEKTKREERERRHQHEGDEEEGSSKSQERRNPFLFKSNNFFTVYENENGYIRRLKRFDQRSDLFENLQNYRLVEYRAKPHTIFLPHHIDADFILTVLSGKAILTVLSPNDRNSYNLKSGDTIKIPSGTTAYIVNQDDEEDLRVVDLVIPVNTPGKFQVFDPAGSKNQYLRGFSKNILEASFNTKYETIEKVLLEETRQGQDIHAIVKVPREQIAELRKLVRSSSRKSLPSEFEPINLRSQNPKYSNKFGRFFEITPQKKYPQLQDLDMLVSSVDIKEGALLLPHYNSRAIVVVLVNEGKGNLELVGLRNEQEEQRERESEKQDRKKQVERYEARLSPGDVVIIPAGHPVAIRASSNLNLLGFGINAENNQRNFLSGSDDNVISQIDNPVKDLTFPGSAQEVNRLLKNQEQSHFANAGPQQKEEESQGKRSPLSSILNTFY